MDKKDDDNYFKLFKATLKDDLQRKDKLRKENPVAKPEETPKQKRSGYKDN